MASVTFPVDLGGSGVTITDDTNPTTGLAAGGHRQRFVPALEQTVAMARTAKDRAQVASDAKADVAQSAQVATQQATIATQKAAAAAQDAVKTANDKRDAALSAAQAKGYSESAQATVTGDMGSVTPQVGKMPIARADGTIDSRWLNPTEVATVATVTWDMLNDTYTGNPHATAVHKAMRRCIYNTTTDEVVYYLDEFDSTKREDGSPADLSGASGQVMVEVPQFWTRTVFHGANKIERSVSPVPLAGFELEPSFDDGDVLKHYIGAYQCSVYSALSAAVIDGLNLDSNTTRVVQADDKLYSNSGNFVMGGLGRQEFRKLAQNNNAQLYDYRQWQMLQLLFLTEYGTHNSQVALGNGNVSGAYVASSEEQEDSPHTINGVSNALGNQSGKGSNWVSYRGIEHPWGNANQYVDGCVASARQMYVRNDESAYSDAVSGHEALGEPMPESGWIKTWQLVKGAMLPAVTGDGATSTSFVGDQLYTNTGLYGVLVGGNAGYGAAAGLSCCYANNAASNRYRSVSSRISKKLRVV